LIFLFYQLQSQIKGGAALIDLPNCRLDKNGLKQTDSMALPKEYTGFISHAIFSKNHK